MIKRTIVSDAKFTTSSTDWFVLLEEKELFWSIWRRGESVVVLVMVGRLRGKTALLLTNWNAFIRESAILSPVLSLLSSISSMVSAVTVWKLKQSC